jgi:hypothetical protein
MVRKGSTVRVRQRASGFLLESGFDDGGAVLDAYPPAATERTDTIEREPLHPRREPLRGDA